MCISIGFDPVTGETTVPTGEHYRLVDQRWDRERHWGGDSLREIVLADQIAEPKEE